MSSNPGEKKPENMPSHEPDNGCLLALLALMTGSSFGAIALSVLQYLYYVFFQPKILQDGQWALVFLATVPLGAFLGGFLGALISLLVATRWKKDD